MNWVYFIQGIDGGPIKIGRSQDPPRRRASLQVGSPVELDLLYALPCGEGRRGVELAEALFYETFSDGRLHGEWFREDTRGLAETIESLIAPDLSDATVAHLHGHIAKLLNGEVYA